MKSLALIFLSGFFLTCLFTTANAAEDQIVIEDLTPAQLRGEIKKIESELYRVFNAENENDEFDIICRKYKPTDSNIRKEACEPKFVTDKRGENATDAQLGYDSILMPEALQSALKPELEAFTEAMNTLINENQYFKELNAILGALREQLEETTS